MVALLRGRRELGLASIPLLWSRLVSAPETPVCVEGTSARTGWRKVVDALCTLVLAFPSQAAAAIVVQADKDLRPWDLEDGSEGSSPSSSPTPSPSPPPPPIGHDFQQRSMRVSARQSAVWTVNTRIVNLLAEIFRLDHDSSHEAIAILAGSKNVLLRATDGMTVDGEACTLPQLELLECIAITAAHAQTWPGTGPIVANHLIDLLQERLPATVQCLSHGSVLVRALSVALLRDMIFAESIPSSLRKTGASASSGACNNGRIQFWDSQVWRKAIEECVAWEARNRKVVGLSTSLLVDAASTLGCQIPA